MSNNLSSSLRTVKNEVLAGVTVSFAMVPEVVGFAIVAGVNPLVGLYAAFTVGLLAAIFGGRPGMISGGAGSLAVVSVTLVARYGVDYLFAAVVLMGIIQAIIGICQWGKFIRMVPHPVMLGFVNGLAMVIFLAQLRQFRTPGPGGQLGWSFGAPFWTMLGLVALTVLVSSLLPRVTRVIPSALAAIIVTILVTLGFGLHTRTVGDVAHIHGALPHFHLPLVPLTPQTLWIVLPYAVVLAAVGLTESLLTLNLIDNMTETAGDSNQECIGQGIANFVNGFFGGMGGCAMIAQSMINITSGGLRRLSGIVEALCILVFIVLTSGFIEHVPLAALVGVMFVVVAKTFAWSSLRILNKIPRADAFVLVLVSIVTVFTNLAEAVVIGIIISALKYAWESASKMQARRYTDAEGRTVYELHGALFFASVHNFQQLFTPHEDTADTLIDFRYSRLYDHSALEAVSALTTRYAALEKRLRLANLSPECRRLLQRAEGAVHVEISSSPHQHIAPEHIGAQDIKP